MLEKALVGIPESFWRQAAAAGQRLLMLDYDGTLAPFRTDPRQAVPLSASVALLRALGSGTHTAVAVLSGRPVGELEMLLAPLHPTFVGENGWEEKAPGGELVRFPLPPAYRLALARAASAATLQSWGWRLERKRASLMLHTRGLPRAEAREVERACEETWRREISVMKLRLERINGGIELGAPGRHKGAAARELLGRSPAGTFAVHIGDDVSDEDAFRDLEGLGFGIRVGEAGRPSRARGRLDSWLDVPLFLRRWIVIVEHREVPEEVRV